MALAVLEGQGVLASMLFLEGPVALEVLEAQGSHALVAPPHELVHRMQKGPLLVLLAL